MFDEMTPERILQSILAAADTSLETREGSFLATMMAPVATELWKMYQAINAVIPIAYVDESSGPFIDLRCGEFGLTRKAGICAEASIKLMGTAGTTVPLGTAFLTADGLEFELMGACTIGADGAVRGRVKAAAVGARYNVLEGGLIRMYTTIPGLTGWVSARATGGSDDETDAALVERLYAYLQKPATSGNTYHYEQWALEVSGVGAVKVTPLWNGPGTVKVLIAGPKREPVDAGTVAAAAAHIEALRPIGASVTVVSAVALPIHVLASVSIDSTTTLAAVRTAFVAKLDAYLQGLAFQRDILLYNRVAFLLLDIDGVTDYTALTINGGTGNVVIGAEQVPVLGTVTV